MTHLFLCTVSPSQTLRMVSEKMKNCQSNDQERSVHRVSQVSIRSDSTTASPDASLKTLIQFLAPSQKDTYNTRTLNDTNVCSINQSQLQEPEQRSPPHTHTKQCSHEKIVTFSNYPDVIEANQDAKAWPCSPLEHSPNTGNKQKSI